MLIGTWTPSLPDVPARAVVVAPHPDDEVLGCGMAMRWLSEQGCAVTIVACTDGEGSHPQSTAVTPDVLRRIRADERARALELLEVAPDVIRLGLPDGGLGGHLGRMTTEMVAALAAADVVIAPWIGDDHPDHQAAVRAAATAAARTGRPLWQVPIWGKVRRARAYGARCARLRLTPAAQQLKAAAAAAFVSQLSPVGPGGAPDGPVVHPHEVAAMLDGEELILW